MDNHHGQAREGKIIKILCIVGARPNLMKIAPILRALAEEGLPAKLVHTGQHYDIDLNDTLFAQLGIPEPDVSLRGCPKTNCCICIGVRRRIRGGRW